jgi:L-amino acid N-acyltransferase YncA
MITLRPATIDDLKAVAARNISGGIKEYPDDVNELAAMEYEGKIIMVGGVKLITQTTAWCWLSQTPEALGHIRECYAITRAWLDDMQKNKGIIRLMAAVRPDFEEAVRLVEHLGFQQESIMLDFFGRQPGLMFVRIKEK